MHEVDVGNVEALQGAENRVVIISTVRSTGLRWFVPICSLSRVSSWLTSNCMSFVTGRLATDREQSRGLMHEPKRFNVALTRAKEVLVVVGNHDTLCLDPLWLQFYMFARRNSAFVGPPLRNSAQEDDPTVRR